MKYWYILIVVFVALVGLFFMKTALSPTGLYYHYDEDYVDPVCGPGATISWEADPCKNVEDGVWMRWGTPYTPGMPSNFYYTDYKLENECVSDQEVITYSCVTGGVQHPWMNRPYDAVCTKREVCPQGYSCYNLPPPDNPLLTNYRGICDPDPVCGDGKTEFLKGEVCEYDTDCAMDYTCRQCQCVQGEPVRVDAIKYDPPLDQLKSGDKVHIIIRLIGDASGQKISVNLNGAEVVFTAQQGSTCLVANAQESICSIDAPGTVKYGRNELNVNIVSSGLLTMPFYFDVMLSGAPPIPEDITQILPPYEPPLDDFVVLPPYEPPPEPEPETSTQVLPFICPDVTNIRVTPDPSKLSPGDKIHIIITFDSDASGYDTTFTLNGQSKTIKNIVGDTGYDIKHFSTDAPGTVIKGKNTVVITICDQSFTYIFDVAEKPTPLPIPATPYRFTPVPVVGFKPIQVVVSSREDVLEEGVIPPIKAQLVEPQLTSREHAIISSLLAQEERASLNTLLPGEIKIIKKILQEARYELTPNEVGMVRATVLRSVSEVYEKPLGGTFAGEMMDAFAQETRNIKRAIEPAYHTLRFMPPLMRVPFKNYWDAVKDLYEPEIPATPQKITPLPQIERPEGKIDTKKTSQKIPLTSLNTQLTRVFHFDAPKNSWTFYDSRPVFTGVNTLNTLEPGQTYWILVDADKTIELNGQPQNLMEGWNLVTLDKK